MPEIPARIVAVVIMTRERIYKQPVGQRIRAQAIVRVIDVAQIRKLEPEIQVRIKQAARRPVVIPIAAGEDPSKRRPDVLGRVPEISGAVSRPVAIAIRIAVVAIEP